MEEEECLNVHNETGNIITHPYTDQTDSSKVLMQNNDAGTLVSSVAHNGNVDISQCDVSDSLDLEYLNTVKIVGLNPCLFDNSRVVTGSWKEFIQTEKEIFLKGCKWSPDGTCVLTNSDDHTMRLFDLPFPLYNCRRLHRSVQFPELKPSVKTLIGGLVYDYTWYPLMTSANPDTCCFLTTSFCEPVHMWDAFTGALRCSYRGFNAQDELHAALSVVCDPSGDLVLCGYKHEIKLFQTERPGRTPITTINTTKICDQRGIVSCLAVNPIMPNVFAAGAYSKSIGLYSVDGHGMCLLGGQAGGLTQLAFSEDGSRLYAAGRKDSEILCWDLRNLGKILYVMRRPHSTNQRIYFDLTADNRFLLSGSSDGLVRVWDLLTAPACPTNQDNYVLEHCAQWQASNDCVNGLSIHRQVPVVATASGQRFIPPLAETDDEDSDVFVLQRPADQYEDSLKIWWTGEVQEEQIDE